MVLGTPGEDAGRGGGGCLKGRNADMTARSDPRICRKRDALLDTHLSGAHTTACLRRSIAGDEFKGPMACAVGGKLDGRAAIQATELLCTQ